MASKLFDKILEKRFLYGTLIFFSPALWLTLFLNLPDSFNDLFEPAVPLIIIFLFPALGIHVMTYNAGKSSTYNLAKVLLLVILIIGIVIAAISSIPFS